MKMGPLEKRFVNATTHSRHVADATIGRLRHVPLRAGWRYLDVGCGNGLATLHVADTLGLGAVGVDVDPAQIALARRAAGGRPDVNMAAGLTPLAFWILRLVPCLAVRQRPWRGVAWAQRWVASR